MQKKKKIFINDKIKANNKYYSLNSLQFNERITN
jgi:hypothetical protein